MNFPSLVWTDESQMASTVDGEWFASISNDFEYGDYCSGTVSRVPDGHEPVFSVKRVPGSMCLSLTAMKEIVGKMEEPFEPDPEVVKEVEDIRRDPKKAQHSA